MLKFLVIISAIIVSGTLSIRLITQSQQSVYSSSLPTTTPSISSENSIKGIKTSRIPPPSNESPLEISVVPAVIHEIISPDTMYVKSNKKMMKIHLIGLETPTDEQLRRYFNHHEEKILDTVKKMLEGTTVFLVTTGPMEDIEVEPLERYVFQSDMSFLNTRLIAEGLAVYQSENRKNLKYNQEFTNTQLQAQIQHRGIWLETLPTSTPTLSPIVSPTATSQPTQPTVEQKKSLSPSATPTPTVSLVTITPRALIIPTVPTVTPPPQSLSAEKILILINEHRKKLQLPAFEKHEYLCNIANTRAPQLYDEIFINHNVHAGFYAMNLPYWITENMAHYESEEKIMQWWLNSSVHRQAIEGNHTYSCGACFGNSCAQLFTSFVEK